MRVSVLDDINEEGLGIEPLPFGMFYGLDKVLDTYSVRIYRRRRFWFPAYVWGTEAPIKVEDTDKPIDQLIADAIVYSRFRLINRMIEREKLDYLGKL